MNHIDDDCTVITEMPLSDEVVGFIEKGLHRDMTDEDVAEWCDDNLDDPPRYMKSTVVRTCHTEMLR